MVSKKLALPLFSLALAIIGVTFFQSQVSLRPRSIEVMEVGKQSGMVDLSFSSTDSQKINLSINTANVKVAAVQIEISYDAKLLGTPKVEVGNFFAIKLGDITAKDGLIKATVAVAIESGGKAGSGNALTLTFPKRPSQETKIAITGNTMVAAVGYDFNVLKNMASLTLTPAESPIVSSPAPQIQTPAPAQVVPQQSTTPTPRTLIPTNFGNNANSPVLPENTDLPPSSSVWARFLAWLKLLFQPWKH